MTARASFRDTIEAMSDDERIAAINAVQAGRWDLDALRSGVSVCVVLAVPFRILASLVGSDSGGLNLLFFFIYLVVFVIGSGCAAWVQRTGTPLSHALVTALGTALAVEALFVVIRLVRGTSVPWFGVAFTMSLIILCGTIGGFLGNRLQLRGFVPSSRR